MRPPDIRSHHKTAAHERPCLIPVVAPSDAAPLPRGRQAGLDPLAEQIAFEPGDAGYHCCHHPPVGRTEFECQALHCDHGDVPTPQFFQRPEQVRR